MIRNLKKVRFSIDTKSFNGGGHSGFQNDVHEEMFYKKGHECLSDLGFKPDLQDKHRAFRESDSTVIDIYPCSITGIIPSDEVMAFSESISKKFGAIEHQVILTLIVGQSDEIENHLNLCRDRIKEAIFVRAKTPSKKKHIEFNDVFGSALRDVYSGRVKFYPSVNKDITVYDPVCNLWDDDRIIQWAKMLVQDMINEGMIEPVKYNENSSGKIIPVKLSSLVFQNISKIFVRTIGKSEAKSKKSTWDIWQAYEAKLETA